MLRIVANTCGQGLLCGKKIRLTRFLNNAIALLATGDLEGAAPVSHRASAKLFDSHIFSKKVNNLYGDLFRRGCS